MKKLSTILLTAIFTINNAYADDRIMISDAENTLRQMMTDSGSTKFKSVYVHGIYVCGQVNSKNQFGGYTGFQPFFYSKVKVDAMIMEPGMERLFGREFSEKCGI